MMKLYPTTLSPQLAMNFPISLCANIKLWRPQPKPTVIPHAQTRPKTDFTGLCLTIPRLEGTRLFVGPDLCLDMGAFWMLNGCNCVARGSRSKLQREWKSNLPIILCAHPHTYRFPPFPFQLPTVTQTETERWKSNHHLDNEAFTQSWAKECHCMNAVNHPWRKTLLQHTSDG